MQARPPSSQRLAFIRQSLTELISIRDPATVAEWAPTDEQRAHYTTLLWNILDHVDHLRGEGRTRLLDEGETHEHLPEGPLQYYASECLPRLQVLKRALQVLDPQQADLFELLEGIGSPRGAQGRVKATFEVGIDKVVELIDNEPHFEDDFFPDDAMKVMDSKLIGFDPDAWLDRAGQIDAVRMGGTRARLPEQVNLRLLELYRSYLFGNWLSVLALSRSVLEFAIHDNLSRFGINPDVPDDRAQRRGERKSLDALIAELETELGPLDQMDLVRRYGNDYLHADNPFKTKRLLVEREDRARTAIRKLVSALDQLYSAPSTER